MPIHHNMLGNLPSEAERTFVALASQALGAQSCSVHENVLNPGAVVPWHEHQVKEVIVCLSGAGECTFKGTNPERYQAGSVLIIPARTPHTLRNVGSDRLHQLAFLAGVTPSTHWIESEGGVSK